MLVTYFRSSSLGTFSMCEQKYYLTYVLGMKDKENAKANYGNVVHKTLEILGKMKIAKQDKKKHVLDDDFGKLKFSECTIENLNTLAFDHYDAINPGLMLSKERKLTQEWSELAVSRYDGELDPRNQDIESVEEFFEIDIPHEWAPYEYEVGGQILKGQLGIKGTVDMIYREGNKLFHILDYKTGRRYDWSTDEVKTYDSLQNDKQLLLYYYALKNKYPERDFNVSIYYINDHKIDKEMVRGGVFTMVFGPEDYAKAEEMLKSRFEEIRSLQRPALLSQTNSHWKCRSLCAYSKINPDISPDQPVCTFIRDQIVELGIDETTNRYADLSKLTTYTGGGRANVELKNRKS